MTIALVIIVGILATVGGAVLGRHLALREVWAEIGEALDTARASAGRANVNSAKIEHISADWPALLSRWEQLEPAFVTGLSRAADIERRSLETEARMAALEAAIASNFSITLNKGV